MIQQAKDTAMFILPQKFRNNYYNPNGGVRRKSNSFSSFLYTSGGYNSGYRSTQGNPQPELITPFFPATVLLTSTGPRSTITSPPVESVIVTSSFTGPGDPRLLVFRQQVDSSRITAKITEAHNPIFNTHINLTSSIPYFDHSGSSNAYRFRHDNLGTFLF